MEPEFDTTSGTPSSQSLPDVPEMGDSASAHVTETLPSSTASAELGGHELANCGGLRSTGTMIDAWV